MHGSRHHEAGPLSPTCLAWLRLRHCTRLSDSIVLRLATVMGGPEAVLEASTSALREALQNRNVATAWINNHDAQGMERDLRWVRGSDRHHIVTWSDHRYPTILREIPGPPMLLYVSGDPGLLDSHQLAIVGSRNPTPGGRSTAARLAGNLVRAGLTITSGLAIGIDAAAHEGALSAAGPTIAVMATGPDRVYPRRHHALANAIADGGALVSELPTGTHPTRRSFPRRNRLISGLSVGTLVVEATPRSGSLITARLAGEQGREVYAVPGSILSPQSRGCHELIRDGATLVENERDILSELAHTDLPSGQAFSASDPQTSDLVHAMGFEPVAVDTIVERSGLTADKVCSMLLRLELQGVVKAMSGGHYIRVG